MAELTQDTEIRERVRERYAAAAKGAADSAACGCSPAAAFTDPDMSPTDRSGTEVFGVALYEEEADAAPRAAVEASLGCGVPTAVANLHDGETVLDLGSGAGADVLISARRVAPGGRAIGLDMTDEMLELARANAAEAGVDNVEFVKGYIEEIPLPDDSVDVVISNCVINLSADKGKVLREVARVLRPGGRFAVSDVIADPDMDRATRSDMEQWTGCIAGALTRGQFEAALADAGLVDLEILETHRVHEYAALGDRPGAQTRLTGELGAEPSVRPGRSPSRDRVGPLPPPLERPLQPRAPRLGAPGRRRLVTVGVAAPLREVLWHAPEVEFWAVDRVDVGSPIATAQARHGRRIAIVSPVAGTLVEVNELLELAPHALVFQPYVRGWVARIYADNWERDSVGLLSGSAGAAEYRARLERTLALQPAGGVRRRAALVVARDHVPGAPELALQLALGHVVRGGGHGRRVRPGLVEMLAAASASSASTTPRS